MTNPPQIAARGAWGTVEWAVTSDGKMPAHEFFQGLSLGDRAKAAALFQRLADTGRIVNDEKFKNLGDRAGHEGRHLYEFKSFQIRLIGDFRPGRRFIVAEGVRKKKDDLPKPAIQRALQVLAAHDSRERGSQ